MVVRKRIAGIGITVGIIIAAIFIAKKFNLGQQIIEGFGGFGSTIGQSFLAIPQGIISGGAQGVGDLSLEAIKISEAFQRFVNMGKLFSDETDLDTSFTFPGAEGAISSLDISQFFSPEAIQQRLRLTTKQATPVIDTSGEIFIRGGTAFGGFTSAIDQETALQKSIRESAEKFPQFFTV